MSCPFCSRGNDGPRLMEDYFASALKATTKEAASYIGKSRPAEDSNHVAWTIRPDDYGFHAYNPWTLEYLGSCSAGSDLHFEGPLNMVFALSRYGLTSMPRAMREMNYEMRDGSMFR